MIILPRQARDKHRESTQTITVYSGLPVRALTNDGEKKRRPKFNFATPFSDETSMTLPRQARGKQERIFSKVRCYAGEDTREQVRKLSLSLFVSQPSFVQNESICQDRLRFRARKSREANTETKGVPFRDAGGRCYAL